MQPRNDDGSGSREYVVLFVTLWNSSSVGLIFAHNLFQT